MKKTMTTLTATLDGLTFSTSSSRPFTHVVIIKQSIAAFLAASEKGIKDCGADEEYAARLRATAQKTVAERQSIGDTMYSMRDCASSLALAQKAAAKFDKYPEYTVAVVELTA